MYFCTGRASKPITAHVVVDVTEVEDFGRFRVRNGEDDGVLFFYPNTSRVIELGAPAPASVFVLLY